MTTFDELLLFFKNLGLYGSAKRPLWNLRMEGAFEGWNWRGIEAMEHRFFLEIHEFAMFKIPSLRVDGSTIDEVADKALKEIAATRERYEQNGWSWGPEAR